MKTKANTSALNVFTLSLRARRAWQSFFIHERLLRFTRNDIFILTLFLLLISHFSFLTYAYASDSKGEEIKAIEVEGLSRIKQEELIDMICLRIGDTIDGEILRDGIKRAFKKGIFLDIQAVIEPYDTGIKLKYIVKEIPVVKRITIDGNEAISKREIKKFFIFKEGETFKEELLDKARMELLRFYHRKGFPDANIKTNVGKDRTTNNVNINLLVEEGPPLIIKKINIPPDVKSLIRISEGDIFDVEQVEKGIKRLRSYYKEQKYIKPIVGPYEFRDSELIIPIIPGPRLEIVFKGNEVFSTKELVKEVPFFENEEVNSGVLQDAVERIKEIYQKKGYYYAQVTGGIETEEALIRVVFFIFEGERVVLREIKFEGIGISPESIKAIISLQENEPFDSTLMNASRESIIGFYNAMGYLYADVTEIKMDFPRNRNEVNLTFVVHQGIQVRIKEINIMGSKAVSTSEIKKILRIEEGHPYNSVDIGDARYRILSLYNTSGYINARIDVESVIKADEAFITFKITENEPSVFGKIVIRGNEKTKAKIIKREFTIKEGEPYNYEAILKTRQRLYKLDLFTDISIEPLETGNFKKPVREGERVHTQDILVDLKEGNPGAVEIGLGYGDYERMRGFFDINYRNLGGYNRQIGLRTELSSAEERYILNFREPWFLNKPSLPLKVFLIKEDRRSVNLDTRELIYKMNILSLLVGVEKEVTERLKANLNYEYSFVDTTEVKPGMVLTKEDSGTVVISSISPSLFYDTRDNPFDPTSGSLKGIVLKFASSAFLSEAEFIKTTLQSAWYFQLKKGLVFAFSLKGGIAHGFKDTEILPIVERFFLGGRTTVRGYNQDTLGTKSADGSPTGGNVFALVNGELRITLWKGLKVATFIDGGNVWRKAGDMEPVLRYTTGLGLRYHTPVGPFRIDYGYKLNKEKGESTGELHFSFGHAF